MLNKPTVLPKIIFLAVSLKLVYIFDQLPCELLVYYPRKLKIHPRMTVFVGAGEKPMSYCFGNCSSVS